MATNKYLNPTGLSYLWGKITSLIDTKADASSVPTKVSDLTNDSGFITSYTETDPTVPAWAKAASKPTYTASEVGAVPNEVSSSGGGNYGQVYNTPNYVKLANAVMSGSSSLELKGSQLTLKATKDMSNTSIVLKTNNVDNIILSEGNTTIIGVVTPTNDTDAANKKYVDDSIPTIPSSLKNPKALTITYGSTTLTYDGSAAKSIEIINVDSTGY